MKGERTITHIGFTAVENGVRITSFAQSPRGSRYAVDSVLVASDGQERRAYKRDFGAAVTLLMGEKATL